MAAKLKDLFKHPDEEKAESSKVGADAPKSESSVKETKTAPKRAAGKTHHAKWDKFQKGNK